MLAQFHLPSQKKTRVVAGEQNGFARPTVPARTTRGLPPSVLSKHPRNAQFTSHMTEPDMEPSDPRLLAGEARTEPDVEPLNVQSMKNVITMRPKRPW